MKALYWIGTPILNGNGLTGALQWLNIKHGSLANLRD